jgi:D-hexose-6-phosphate mutarotase
MSIEMERQFMTELDEILTHRDIKWIHNAMQVYFRIDEDTNKIILDDEEMLNEFNDELDIVKNEVAKFNEIVDEINREKNMDYAMDNTIDDEDNDNG